MIIQTSITRQPEYVIKMIIDNIPSDWTYIHYTDDEIIDFFNNNYIEEFSNVIDKFHNMPIGMYHFRYHYLDIIINIITIINVITTITINIFININRVF